MKVNFQVFTFFFCILLILKANAITNGRPFIENELLRKSIVETVLKDPESTHWCTGVMITKRHVLTAAHCTAKFNHEIQVRFHGLKKPKNYEILNIYEHPGYSTFVWGSAQDVAILELQTEISSAIPLQLLKGNILPTQVPWIIAGMGGGGHGWGETSSISEKHSKYLTDNFEKAFPQIKNDYYQDTGIEIAEIQGWLDSFKNPYGNADMILTAPNQEVFVCGGDSGSPLILDIDGEYQIAGILSLRVNTTNIAKTHQLGCDQSNAHGYSNIKKTLYWIKNIASLN